MQEHQVIWTFFSWHGYCFNSCKRYLRGGALERFEFRVLYTCL